MIHVEATIETVPGYRITINGVTHEGFARIDEWQGFTRYVNSEGTVIVSNGPFDFIDSIFGIKTVKAIVVKASPGFFAAAGKDGSK